MKIHAYLLCYNEERIIKNILDYYSIFCSRIFVMDNVSTDRTLEIVKGYKNVTVISWENDGYIDQSLYVKMKSETYKMHSRFGGKYTEEIADWIISCDMDEVLYHPNIIDVLSYYDEIGVTVPAITGFNMVGENEINPNESIIKQYKLGNRALPFDKRVVFKVDFDMKYSVGCHPRGDGFSCMKSTYKYKSSNEHPIALLHYKNIGDRAFQTAGNIASRINPVGLKENNDGSFSGKGSHYLNTAKQKIEINRKGRVVFDDFGRVCFDNFLPSTGENGLDDSIKASDDIIDNIRSIAIRLERYEESSLKECVDLIRIALKFRPKGKRLHKLLERYLSKQKKL